MKLVAGEDQKPEHMVSEYLVLEEEIKALQAEQKDIKKRLEEALVTEDAQPQTWEYHGYGTVSLVNGRTSTKINRKKLIIAGVAADIVEAATETTTGLPHLRISHKKD